MPVTVTIDGVTIIIYSAAEAGKIEEECVSVEHLGEPVSSKDAVKLVIADIEALDAGEFRVNCHAGLHRSALIAMLFLWKKSGESDLKTVYVEVAKQYGLAGKKMAATLIKGSIIRLLYGLPKRGKTDEVFAALLDRTYNDDLE